MLGLHLGGEEVVAEGDAMNVLFLLTKLKCWLGFHWRLQWVDETVPLAYQKRYLCGWCKKALP